MATKKWQVVKIRHCEHVGCDVALEAETILPSSDFLADQAPRLGAHRCAHMLSCNSMDEAACIWAGSNPGYDPFKEDS